MIVPIVQTESRHSLNVETADHGVIALVEITHIREAVTEREVVDIVVRVDDDDVVVKTTVKSA